MKRGIEEVPRKAETNVGAKPAPMTSANTMWSKFWVAMGGWRIFTIVIVVPVAYGARTFPA